jgi:hypothetical protein
MPTHNHGTRLATKDKIDSVEATSEYSNPNIVNERKREVMPSPNKGTGKRRVITKSTGGTHVAKQIAQTSTQVSRFFISCNHNTGDQYNELYTVPT